MGISDYGVDLMYFWRGTCVDCMEERQLARAGTVGLGRLKIRARTGRQLKTALSITAGLHFVSFVWG